jgi:hypothetical protein
LLHDTLIFIVLWHLLNENGVIQERLSPPILAKVHYYKNAAINRETTASYFSMTQQPLQQKSCCYFCVKYTFGEVHYKCTTFISKSNRLQGCNSKLAPLAEPGQKRQAL